MTRLTDTTPRRPGGRSGQQRPDVAPWPDVWFRLAPFAVATALLTLGYIMRERGTAHTDQYHLYSFGSLNYSDIIWLYLRDRLFEHPRPYLDYPLEYPPLTGALTYLLSFAPGLPAYFALTYALLALAGLGTVGALGGIPGADRWYVAAAPGLLLLGGLNWDLAAIGLTALALFAYARGRDVWGTLALLAAVWLKLFPIVFLAAILVERLRERRWRDLATIGTLFAVGSVAINLPLARANREGWSFFFRLNNDRGAEPSIWTLLPPLTIPQINTASLALLALGGLAFALIALRARTPVTPLLGATLLVWWLFVNKIYSPQYSLWVYLALALLASSRLLWGAFAIFDAAYYFASFQILYTAMLQIDVLVEWQTRYLVHPLVAVRLVLLGAITVAGGYALWQLAQRQSIDTLRTRRDVSGVPGGRVPRDEGVQLNAPTMNGAAASVPAVEVTVRKRRARGRRR